MKRRFAYTLLIACALTSLLLFWRSLKSGIQSPAPTILTFTVSPQTVTPGEPVKLRWTSIGATRAHITETELSRPDILQSYTELPTSGELDLVTDPESLNTYQFALNVTTADGRYATTSINLHFNCSTTYFFTPAPEFCPEPAKTLSMVAQPFEEGWMLWMPDPNGSALAMTYAFISGGKIWDGTDDWLSTQPDSDPTLQPPAGKYQPTRSLGKAWRENDGLKSNLGWATAPEQNYLGTFQKETGRYKVGTQYVNLPDGHIIRILWNSGGAQWDYVKQSDVTSPP